MMCHIFVDIAWENWGFRILHISMSLSYLLHLSFYERYWSGFVVVAAVGLTAVAVLTGR
jgi:hypothetical protein